MLPVVGQGTGVKVPALCLPEWLCTSSAVIRKFAAGEIELVSGLSVARATQRDPDNLKRVSFLFLYIYVFNAFCAILLGSKSRHVQKGAGPTQLYCQSSSSLLNSV